MPKEKAVIADFSKIILYKMKIIELSALGHVLRWLYKYISVYSKSNISNKFDKISVSFQ